MFDVRDLGRDTLGLEKAFDLTALSKLVACNDGALQITVQGTHINLCTTGNLDRNCLLGRFRQTADLFVGGFIDTRVVDVSLEFIKVFA